MPVRIQNCFYCNIKGYCFLHYLEHTNELKDESSIYFFLHFKGEKNKSKFNELNATLSYFVLKVRKKTKKKGCNTNDTELSVMPFKK